MLAQVRAFARRHQLWGPQTRLVAAVSGGSDSVALLLLLAELHARGELRLDAVAHLHHGIRGADADTDEAFCRDLAARVSLPFVAARVDVPARARAAGESIEVAARRARLEFFATVRRDRGADLVATGHTRDDQAETVLLRIARGTGLRGLGGMAPRRGTLIRPLLDCTRRDLQAWLRASGETWREDATNRELITPRNRVRHELLPYLRQWFNPAAARALAALADHARTDGAWLDELGREAAGRLLRVADGRVAIDRAELHALPPPLARRVAALAIAAAGGNPARLRSVDLVRAVAAGETAAGGLPGLRVEHSGASVVLVPERSTSRAPGFRFDLPVPGRIEAPVVGWTLEAVGPIVRADHDLRRTADEAVVDAAGLGARLVVRNRRAGDRLRPLGLGGSKKVQDLLVDRKVRREDRDRVPIVTDAAGRIVWVGGHAMAEEFRVTEGTNAVVVLKLRRI